MALPPPGTVEPQKNTWGGFQTATQYSGAVAPFQAGGMSGGVVAGSDVLIFSGAGRLDYILPTQQISGVQITFYDAAAVASGGPFASSGHKIIAVVPANTFGNPFGTGPSLLQFSTPFQSGLAYNSRSGQPGFTVQWTPEVPRQ